MASLHKDALVDVLDHIFEGKLAGRDEGVAHTHNRGMVGVRSAGAAVGLHPEPGCGLQRVHIAFENTVFDDGSLLTWSPMIR
jgi:hypothetical protein